MLRVYSCLVEDHDPALVALAAGICLFACLVALQIYGRARADRGASRLGWLGVMGAVAGIGTWATHFVAMIAYQPGLPAAYAPELTAVSLAIAVGVMTAGAIAAAAATGTLGRALGGALVGAGVGAMHYTGMAALLVPGALSWSAGYVLVSLAVGIGLGAGAFVVAQDGTRHSRLAFAAVVLTAAIAGLHFIGMAAAVIEPNPAIVVPDSGISSAVLATAVALSTALVLCVGGVSVAVDRRARRGEQERLRDFADAAVEGLVLCDNGTILDANESFCTLSGLGLGELRGRAFQSLLSLDTRDRIDPASPFAAEGSLLRTDGSPVPVAIIARTLRGRGQAQMVFAVRDLREQKEAERRIRFLAHHDALTGLANRVTFTSALDDALRNAQRGGDEVAVLCVDLDHFKNVNDLYGHLTGDALLVEASRRMRRALAEDDLLARLGGDEFAIIHRTTDQGQSAAALAKRLIEAAADDFLIAGHNILIGFSIGLAVGPRDGHEPERLLANADTALYRAKSEGRGRFRCFEPEMDQQVRERHELAAELRRAIARDELTLYFQPQVKAASGDLIGFEALARWIHPKRGVVSPADFIPIAEETGQIIALGEWVLRSACREAMRWTRPLKVAVNLSTVQFQQMNLPEVVHAVLLETGLPPSRLELEITETVIINDMSRALSLLRRLKALGVSIAMDDFGTGYSSLATLQAFTFDKLKIDRSFVSRLESNPQAAVIVRAVLGLGRNLGMGVVAEGVETAAQLKFLSDESCDEIQGHFFGRPQPIEFYAHEVYGGGALRKIA
jgi:diguanylate cyclase